MAGLTNKKRRNEGKGPRPTKKQRKAQAYNSDSEGEDEQSFDAVNLLDSDDDIHNVKVDDGADVEGDDSSSSDEEGPDSESANIKSAKSTVPSQNSNPEEDDQDSEGGDDDDDDDDEDDDGDDGDEDEMDLAPGDAKAKAKRNDPTAFATSLSKILSTKLSASKRSDPVMSRSTAAHSASKAAVDNALEAKAKRKLKEEKRLALEKGRVKDILVPLENEATGEQEMSTAEILETERKLKKIAQRGVVRLFNAVRAAQVKAAEAEKDVKKEGVIGHKVRGEKVNEMSKKGFLDLIASGGGGLKKTPLEEA